MTYITYSIYSVGKLLLLAIAVLITLLSADGTGITSDGTDMASDGTDMASDGTGMAGDGTGLASDVPFLLKFISSHL